MLKLVPKWLIAFIVVALILLILVLVLVLPGITGGGTPNPGTTTGGTTAGGQTDGGSSGDDGPRTDLVDVLKNKNFLYAGVTDEDTVALIDDKSDEVVVRLDHKEWKDIQWSPGGLVSVLGRTGGVEESVDDLFIFKFDSAEWEQLTFYQDVTEGVESYFWTSEDTIAFIQGSGSERWLHEYDFPNRELTKVFKITGDILGYLPEEKQFVLRTDAQLDLTQVGGGKERDNVLSLIDMEGREVIKFNGFSDIDLPVRLDSLTYTHDQQSFILKGRDLVSQRDRLFLWSFTDPFFREAESDFGINTICEFDRNNMLAVFDDGGVLKIGLLNTVTTGTATFSSLALQVQSGLEVDRKCDYGEELVTLSGNFFEISGTQLTRLTTQNKYTELMRK